MVIRRMLVVADVLPLATTFLVVELNRHRVGNSNRSAVRQLPLIVLPPGSDGGSTASMSRTRSEHAIDLG
jgi:hypothetical protein